MKQKKDGQKAKGALVNILNMEKRLPDDFDAERELHEARVEKFENLTSKSLVDKFYLGY